MATVNRIRADYDKISVTAKLVAFFRTFSDIPYSEQIAKEIGAEKAVRDFIGNALSFDMMRSRGEFAEIRYKATNKQIRRLGTKNILEVASGVSPRALEMSEDPSITYVSTDLKDMI